MWMIPKFRQHCIIVEISLNWELYQTILNPYLQKIDAWSSETSSPKSWVGSILYCCLQLIWREKHGVFFPGGTIADLIQEIKKSCSEGNWPVLSETDSLGYLEDVLKAVEFLHSKGIVHRDIKGKVKNRIFFTSVSSYSSTFREGLASLMYMCQLAIVLIRILNNYSTRACYVWDAAPSQL